MTTYAGSMRMSMNPAGAARVRACGRYGSSSLAWLLVDAGAAAKQEISASFDVPATTTHRHRRPWGTS